MRLLATFIGLGFFYLLWDSLRARFRGEPCTVLRTSLRWALRVSVAVSLLIVVLGSLVGEQPDVVGATVGAVGFSVFFCATGATASIIAIRNALKTIPRKTPTCDPPPAPTRAARAAAARERYESTLRMLEAAHLDDDELEAARTLAKQRYLREIGGTIE